MAKVVYVNGATGSDLNSGLSPGLAKATIVGARAATDVGDRVSIATGVYPEIDATFSAATDDNVVYMHDGSGPVIIDFLNRATAGQHWLTSRLVKFIGLQFRNPGTATLCVSAFSATTRVDAINCVFYQKSGAANTGHGIQRAVITNCSFHNLNICVGISSSTANSYMLSCTTPFSGAQNDRDYNAFPGNTETHGVNISTGANPGFRDTALDDFRLSQSNVSHFQTFMTSGRYRGRIGASGATGPYYNSAYAQTRLITPDPLPPAFAAWENDPTYTSVGILGAVIQDPTTGEVQLDQITTPNATDGRMRSEVFVAPMGKVFRITGSSIDRFEDRPAGAALDTNTALPAQWEYRYSDHLFNKGDSIPVWLPIQQLSTLNTAHRYFQFRVTLRTDHLNI